MWTNILIILSTVVIPVVVSEDVPKQTTLRTNYLRNFYNNREDHERHADYFMQMRQIETETTGSLHSQRSTHKIRHRAERKISKVKRCRRYAQLYYQNYIGTNCYYAVCRQSYCGYCPTSSCRRRCPYNCVTKGNDQNAVTSNPMDYSTTQLSKECNCDKQGSQMQACDEKTGKCRCKPHYTGPKCDRCEDGYWKNNSVCVPCNCDVNGSRSTTCDPDTGLCPCKRGVEGQKCNSCQNKYYGSVTVGCKACDPCEKEGHICHPENGKCVCPQLTTGAKCERCGADAWGYEPGIGCKSCRCSTTGSASTQCDLVTGRCTCKIGFEGEKCDKCSFGYYNYPDCTKCNCNVAGTRPEDCSNGSCKCDHRKCRCKNNVEGPNCDRCKKNTYDLDPSNPQGCTNCFCSNRSTTCRASTFIWDQIRTASVENVKLQKCVNKMPCWSLPNKFTGDLIPSYGGYFRILSNSSQNRVYIIGNGITAEANTDQRGDIRITNVGWKLTSDSYPSKLPKECSTYLTRPCFMLILQNVSKILIEPVTSKQIKFSEVLLDKMSNTVGTSQASSVENCSCPKEYTSFSCQDPSTGYFRYYPKEFEPEYNYIDKTIGVAKPCQCNNRSNICDKQTGHCRDCVGFTTGSHCELCKEGYYRNSSGGCSPCLCPSEEQNFAKNCTIIGGTRKQFKCTCKTGYSGSKCNECSKGYWGNLLQKGGTCKPCKCNSHGSESLQCDKRTGHCKCKSGFTGVKCSKCSSPRQIIQNGVCVPCDECTQILFNTLDGLSKGLNETLGIFENGLGPPWTLLNSTLNRYGLLMLRFKNLEIAKNLLQNINIPKIENKLEQIKEKVLEQNRMLTLQKDFADRVQEESIMLSENIQDLDNRSNIIINNVNKFGQSHIDIREALQEAEELLKDIYSISKEIPSSDRYEDIYNKCDQLFKGINDTYNVDLNSKKIMAKLDELKSKLADLDIILRRISRINEFVKNKNKQNANGIVDLNITINEINNKNLIINDDVGDLLKKINVTDDLLREMKKIYKHLSQLDVEKATNDIDKDDVAQVYDTLSVVREHVKKLQNKIKNYKNLFNFTSEEWTKIDASGAYDNIAKGIQLARREADHARNITVDILNKIYPSDDDSLSDKANLAKAFSDRIQKRVINLENLTDDLRKNTENLEDLKHDIQINGKNNNELNAFLRDLRQNISNQTKDIHNLEKMKSNVRNISSLISSIEQGIKDTNVTMQYEVTKTYQKYLDLVSSDEIVNFLKNINATKKQFEEITIFSNLTAIDRIKDANANKFNNTKRNLEIIQKEISQLIDNINYANEQVEAVEYGVDIGKCERYYKLQNDILRSLEINFSCNGTCNLFELNNSDNEKIKISYENNMINVLWKKHTRKINSSNSVILKRVGSMIEMKTENETLSFYDDEPFHIEDKHYLKIGKLTNKQNVSGQCLRRIVLNGQTIGLWKFDRSKGNCSACYR
jgi:laminin alpha 1/2